MTYQVRLTREAASALSGDGQALNAIQAGFATLQSSPFTCRKAGPSPFLRELIIPFGRSGYVALFEIESSTDVVLIAVRDQLEEDYY